MPDQILRSVREITDPTHQGSTPAARWFSGDLWSPPETGEHGSPLQRFGKPRLAGQAPLNATAGPYIENETKLE